MTNNKYLSELDNINTQLTIHKTVLRKKNSLNTRNDLVDALFSIMEDVSKESDTVALRYAQGIAIEHSHRRLETGGYGVSVAIVLGFYSTAFSTSYFRSYHPLPNDSKNIKQDILKLRKSFISLCDDLSMRDPDEATRFALKHVRNLKWPGIS